MDVKSLYTVIPHIGGIEAMRQVLCESSMYHGPPIEFILELLSLILHNNHFRFEDRWYLQVAGTSMGSAMAPMYANAYMYAYETQHILTTYKNNIIGYYRYIDDLLIIWRGSQTEAHMMVEELNLLPTPIKFTANISEESVQYLDLELSYGDNRVQYTLFSKQTDRNTLLHARSAHPISLKKSIPKAQFQRVIRNNSDINKAELQLKIMTQKFLNRGYNIQVLEEALLKAKLAPVQKMDPVQKIVFPMTFHNSSNLISTIVKDNWKMIATDDTLPKIFKETPLICYRRNKRNKSLKDMLTPFVVRGVFVYMVAKETGLCDREYVGT
ncbi:Hypothetical predicted protein [Pelobates cultripes]|uniref:Reverse transcriptase domain-containing protein n=1 Tax=Pelobates cultripes TaxID=61616 RepID=A0AAD1RV74_PELCU|nr:Hypothetical predicted protein [Pelobates cultripes]